MNPHTLSTSAQRQYCATNELVMALQQPDKCAHATGSLQNTVKAEIR